MALSVLLESGITVFTIGGNAITCAVEIEFNEPHAVYRSQCDGTPIVRSFAEASGTLTCEIPLASWATQAGYLAPGPKTSAQALVLQPGGATATYTDIDATNIEFTDRITRWSTSGVATVTSPFVVTGLTYAAVSA